MNGMSDFSYSMAMRDVIDRLVTSTIDRIRPAYKYAIVTAVNWQSNKCTVQYIGETSPVIVNTGRVEPMIGQKVRIEGYGTDKFVAGIVGAYDPSPIHGSVEPYYTSGNPKVILDGSDGVIDKRRTYWSANYQPRASDRILAFPMRDNTLYIEKSWELFAPEFIQFLTPSLQNGWVRYNDTYSAPGYARSEAGVVMLRGLMRSGIFSDNTLLFTLPEGFRPLSSEYSFIVPCGGNKPARVDVLSDGSVILKSSGGGDNSYLSLSGICFHASAAEVDLTWIAPTFSSTFADYATSPWPLFSCALDEYGFVWHRGMVRATTTPTIETIMLSRSSTYGPQKQLHVPCASDGPFTSVDIRNDGSSAYKAGGSRFISLSGNPYGVSSVGFIDIPYSSGWVSYSTSFSQAGYYKRPDGIVVLRGLVKRESGSTAVVIGTLPAGVRPLATNVFEAVSANASARVDVNPDGTVSIFGTPGIWLSLDGISFAAEQ